MYKLKPTVFADKQGFVVIKESEEVGLTFKTHLGWHLLGQNPFNSLDEAAISASDGNDAIGRSVLRRRNGFPQCFGFNLADDPVCKVCKVFKKCKEISIMASKIVDKEYLDSIKPKEVRDLATLLGLKWDKRKTTLEELGEKILEVASGMTLDEISELKELIDDGEKPAKDSKPEEKPEEGDESGEADVATVTVTNSPDEIGKLSDKTLDAIGKASDLKFTWNTKRATKIRKIGDKAPKEIEIAESDFEEVAEESTEKAESQKAKASPPKKKEEVKEEEPDENMVLFSELADKVNGIIPESFSREAAESVFQIFSVKRFGGEVPAKKKTKASQPKKRSKNGGGLTSVSVEEALEKVDVPEGFVAENRSNGIVGFKFDKKPVALLVPKNNYVQVLLHSKYGDEPEGYSVDKSYYRYDGAFDDTSLSTLNEWLSKAKDIISPKK